MFCSFMIRETYSYSVANNPLFLKMPVRFRCLVFWNSIWPLPQLPLRMCNLMFVQEWLYIATCLSAYFMGPCYVILMFALPAKCFAPSLFFVFHNSSCLISQSHVHIWNQQMPPLRFFFLRLEIECGRQVRPKFNVSFASFFPDHPALYLQLLHR